MAGLNQFVVGRCGSEGTTHGADLGDAGDTQALCPNGNTFGFVVGDARPEGNFVACTGNRINGRRVQIIPRGLLNHGIAQELGRQA